MKYIGSKALDAEIDLDLVNGNILIDYSLNKYGNPLLSNTSCVLESEWRKLPLATCIKYGLIDIGLMLMALPVCIIMIVITYTHLEPDAQYRYQKFMKWYCTNTMGISEQSRSGEMKEPVLIFTIPHNIWFEYSMEGDYERNLKKISLKRNFVDRKRYGRFSEKRQRGWNVIFEFSEMPQSGRCRLQYI